MVRTKFTRKRMKRVVHFASEPIDGYIYVYNIYTDTRQLWMNFLSAFRIFVYSNKEYSGMSERRCGQHFGEWRWLLFCSNSELLIYYYYFGVAPQKLTNSSCRTSYSTYLTLIESPNWCLSNAFYTHFVINTRIIVRFIFCLRCYSRSVFGKPFDLGWFCIRTTYSSYTQRHKPQHTHKLRIYSNSACLLQFEFVQNVFLDLFKLNSGYASSICHDFIMLRSVFRCSESDFWHKQISVCWMNGTIECVTDCRILNGFELLSCFVQYQLLYTRFCSSSTHIS